LQNTALATSCGRKGGKTWDARCKGGQGLNDVDAGSGSNATEKKKENFRQEKGEGDE